MAGATGARSLREMITHSPSMAEQDFDDLMSLPNHILKEYIRQLQEQADLLEALKYSCKPADFHVMSQHARSLLELEPSPTPENLRASEIELESERLAASNHSARWRVLDPLAGNTASDWPVQLSGDQIVVTNERRIRRKQDVEDGEHDSNFRRYISAELFWSRLHSLFFNAGCPWLSRFTKQYVRLGHKDGSTLYLSEDGVTFLYLKGTEEAELDTCELLEYLIRDCCDLTDKHPVVQDLQQ